MSAPARRTLTYALVGAVATAVFIALVLLLLRQGLDNADKLSSVISMVAGVVSLVVAIWSLRQAIVAERRAPGGPKVVNHLKRNDVVIIGDHNEQTVYAGEVGRRSRRRRT